MVRFIVDSTFGLSRAFAQENNIEVVSLTITLDGEEFTEGYREEWGEFYDKYTKSKSGAKTSQPSPQKFQDAIDRILAQDADSEIFILTIADRLSGTIGSANIAAAQYPDKKIKAINSCAAGVSSWLYFQEMLKAAQSGATFEELIALSDDLIERIAMQFIPASLYELARGGRVNKLLSRIGNILNIKPVFEFAKNDLSVYSKTLGFNRAVAAAIAHLPKKLDRVIVYYIADDKNVALLKEKLTAALGITDIEVEPMCPVGGVHVGVGTVGIVTLASKEQ